MSTNQNGSGGADDQAAGGADEKPKQKDVVQYETHVKLLDEKKRLQEEKRKLEEQLQTVQKEKADREKAELEQQGNFKKLLEQERENAAKLEAKHNSLLSDLEFSSKRRAVLKFINGSVRESALPLLKVDGVALNEDGTVNEDTAKVVAQEFEKIYNYAIETNSNNGNIPNHAANAGAGQKLTRAEWEKIPTFKEMKKRFGEVDWNT